MASTPSPPCARLHGHAYTPPPHTHTRARARTSSAGASTPCTMVPCSPGGCGGTRMKMGGKQGGAHDDLYPPACTCGAALARHFFVFLCCLPSRLDEPVACPSTQRRLALASRGPHSAAPASAGPGHGLYNTISKRPLSPATVKSFFINKRLEGYLLPPSFLCGLTDDHHVIHASHRTSYAASRHLPLAPRRRRQQRSWCRSQPEAQWPLLGPAPLASTPAAVIVPSSSTRWDVERGGQPTHTATTTPGCAAYVLCRPLGSAPAARPPLPHAQVRSHACSAGGGRFAAGPDRAACGAAGAAAGRGDWDGGGGGGAAGSTGSGNAHVACGLAAAASLALAAAVLVHSCRMHACTRHARACTCSRVHADTSAIDGACAARGQRRPPLRCLPSLAASMPRAPNHAQSK